MPSFLRNYENDGAIPDEEWKKLISQDRVDRFKKKADEKFEGIDSEAYYHLRAKCKSDLWFLNTGILGHTRLDEGLHGHLCSWADRNNEWQFREILLPRGHFKSTVMTLGDGIQIVLPCDKDVIVPWPRNLGTDCRLLISHETDGQASNFLFAITAHFLSNPLMMGLFPEAVPSSRKHRINRHELELPRSHTWPEPTIDTMGVGGRSQGRHYNYIKFDDLIGDKARDSETVMEAAKLWFDNIQSFFSKFSEDHFDLIGTRWAFDDLYAHIHNVYEDQLLRYIRGIEEPQTLIVDGKERIVQVPIFEREFPQEKLMILRKNRKVWSAQYANNPEEGATEFEAGWKRFYHKLGYNTIVVFSGKSETRINIRDLDICILVDPAMSGLGGVVVTGSDKANRIFILEAHEKEWKPPELCELMFRLNARYRPRCVAIEEVLFSGLFKIWFEREMQFRNQYFNIVPVSPVVGGRTLSKPMRVRGLENYFSAASIYFCSSDMDELIREYDTFGANKKIHMLDALAYGPEVWMPSVGPKRMEVRRKAENAMLLERDLETGYSIQELMEMV